MRYRLFRGNLFLLYFHALPFHTLSPVACRLSLWPSAMLASGTRRGPTKRPRCCKRVVPWRIRFSLDACSTTLFLIQYITHEFRKRYKNKECNAPCPSKRRCNGGVHSFLCFSHAPPAEPIPNRISRSMSAKMSTKVSSGEMERAITVVHARM